MSPEMDETETDDHKYNPWEEIVGPAGIAERRDAAKRTRKPLTSEAMSRHAKEVAEEAKRWEGQTYQITADDLNSMSPEERLERAARYRALRMQLIAPAVVQDAEGKPIESHLAEPGAASPLPAPDDQERQVS